MQIDDYLYQKDLYLSLARMAQKPMKMTEGEQEVLDLKALGAIWLSLASTIVFNVYREKMTQDLIAALSKIYKKSSSSNKIFLMKKLFNLKMADSKSVTEHPNEFNMLTS